VAAKPVVSPPNVAIRMPAASHESVLYTRRAQAKEHEWQPMQRSILGVVKIFMLAPPDEYDSAQCSFKEQKSDFWLYWRFHGIFSAFEPRFFPLDDSCQDSVFT
jgi:hypothetical protein